MGDRVRISQAGNTWIPAVLVLRERGYAVTNHRQGNEEYCVAEKDQLKFSASDPEAVLGLVALYEARGADWMAADPEIDQVMAEFGLL